MQKSRAHVAEAPVPTTTGTSTHGHKRRPSSRLSTTAATASDTARHRADQAPGSSYQSQPGQQPPHEMPAPDAAEDIRLTRTGRISKASKGRRVHTCECGRTYTRNEHLSRHQQSHKPDAFPCDIAGCKRSFNREDLLDRHKVRHHGIPSDTSDAHSSLNTQKPLPTVEGECPSPMAAPAVQPSLDESTTEHTLLPTTSQPSHAFEQSQFDLRTQGQPLHAFHHAPRAMLSAVRYSSSADLDASGYTSDSSSIAYSSAGYHSPSLHGSFTPYFATRDHNESESSETSYRGHAPRAHQSPVVPLSSTSHPLYGWNTSMPTCNVHFPATQALAEEQYNVSFPTAHDNIPVAQMGYRGMTGQLGLPVQIYSPEMIAGDFSPRTTTADGYIEGQWTDGQPCYPVVYRASVDAATASPLLNRAMMMRGTNSQGSESGKKQA